MMQMQMHGSHGTYPVGIHGLGGLGGIGQIAAPFIYIPDLGPVGSKSTYFPRDVENDAKALNFTGFMSDAEFSDGMASVGSQSGDIANESGAWDPGFRAAVTRFQAAKGLTVDSWIGPQTRTALAIAVTAANAKGVPAPPVGPLPPLVVPVNPGGVPAKPGALPGIVPTNGGGGTSSDETMTYVAIGAGVLAVIGLGWWALS